MITSDEIPEAALRSAFSRTLVFQTGWTILVGLVFLVLPEGRFSSPSWQFIELAPHGDDIIGTIYLLLGIVMAATLKRDRGMAVTLGLAGMLNWTLGIFLLAGALSGSAGGLGFPLALFPGWHMISTAATLSARK